MPVSNVLSSSPYKPLRYPEVSKDYVQTTSPILPLVPGSCPAGLWWSVCPYLEFGKHDYHFPGPCACSSGSEKWSGEEDRPGGAGRGPRPGCSQSMSPSTPVPETVRHLLSFHTPFAMLLAHRPRKAFYKLFNLIVPAYLGVSVSACVCVCVSVCVSVSVSLCVYLCLCVWFCVFLCICGYLCVYLGCVRVCAFLSVSVCTCVGVHTQWAHSWLWKDDATIMESRAHGRGRDLWTETQDNVSYLVPLLPPVCFVQVTMLALVSSSVKFRSWSEWFLWLFPAWKPYKGTVYKDVGTL